MIMDGVFLNLHAAGEEGVENFLHFEEVGSAVEITIVLG